MTFHIVELVVQMVIFLLLSAAQKRNLLYKIRYAMLQCSTLSPNQKVLLCFASVTQIHVYLLWGQRQGGFENLPGQRQFSIVS